MPDISGYFQNPLVLGGLGLLTGGGMGALNAGVQSGVGMQKWNRENAYLGAQQQAFEALQNDPTAFQGLPPGMAKMVTAMGPQGIPYAVQAYLHGKDAEQAQRLADINNSSALARQQAMLEFTNKAALEQKQKEFDMINELVRNRLGGGNAPAIASGAPAAPSPAPSLLPGAKPPVNQSVRVWTPNGFAN